MSSCEYQRHGGERGGYRLQRPTAPGLLLPPLVPVGRRVPALPVPARSNEEPGAAVPASESRHRFPGLLRRSFSGSVWRKGTRRRCPVRPGSGAGAVGAARWGLRYRLDRGLRLRCEEVSGSPGDGTRSPRWPGYREPLPGGTQTVTVLPCRCVLALCVPGWCHRASEAGSPLKG